VRVKFFGLPQHSAYISILQGARMRNIKTEYVSCPSCGRTLFDLQEVTEQIRTRTGHLPGAFLLAVAHSFFHPAAISSQQLSWSWITEQIRTVTPDPSLHVQSNHALPSVLMPAAMPSCCACSSRRQLRFRSSQCSPCVHGGRTDLAFSDLMSAGVSIAVMGCIVNGPGEMADADFG